MIIKSHSEAQTKKIGQNLGKKLKKGQLLCLYGSLGTGKTTFVRGLAKGLSIKTRIQSPTFTYQRVYEKQETGIRKKIKLYHFDCYRVSKPDFLLISDVNEVLEREDGIVAIEWAEKIAAFLPKQRIEVYFEYVDDAVRKIQIKRPLI